MQADGVVQGEARIDIRYAIEESPVAQGGEAGEAEAVGELVQQHYKQVNIVALVVVVAEIPVGPGQAVIVVIDGAVEGRAPYRRARNKVLLVTTQY